MAYIFHSRDGVSAVAVGPVLIWLASSPVCANEVGYRVEKKNDEHRAEHLRIISQDNGPYHVCEHGSTVKEIHREVNST